MIVAEVQKQIADELRRIEGNEGCRILLAVESGSRAWGFPSQDSDYDVRFVYIRCSNWYLSVDLELKRDVIERPINDDLDISGWDIRKALRLFAKSNPPLLEWLCSPIIYQESCDFALMLKRLLPVFYSPVSSVYHYLHMAEGNYREYLKGDVVWLKKYLYALRPLLAVIWLEQGRGMVPMEFSKLLVTIEDQHRLVEDIKSLIARKMAGEELDRGPQVPRISDFVARELERIKQFKPSQKATAQNFDPLNKLFQEMLSRAWSAA
jgi:predicted nucleotidyltransferase